jgi:ATP-dependent DNA helicase RecG
MEWKEIEKLLDKIYDGKKTGEDIEGQFIDVKSFPPHNEELMHICKKVSVAFSNSNGGTIVFGVENKIVGPDAFTGCPLDTELWKIDKGVRDGTKQSVHVRSTFHTYKGIELIEVNVPQGLFEGAHAFTDGRAWYRSGKECVPMPPDFYTSKAIQPERIDYSRFYVENLEFDDLDKNEIDTLRKHLGNTIGSKDFLKHKDDIDLLKALRVVHETSDGKLEFTVSSLLFLGKEESIKEHCPCSEIVFIAYDEKGREQTLVRYGKGLLSNVIEFQKMYDREYNLVHHLDTGLFEVEIKKIPDEVFREAILNAIAHREYRIQSCIFFKHYPDRIELKNPGDFCGDITTRNILNHIPVWRNFLLSDIFLRVGLVRKLGWGVDTIYQCLLNHGKEPPIYQESGQEITLTIFDRIDEGFAKYLQNLENNNQGLPLDEMIILSKLKSQDRITTNEAAEAIQRNQESARMLLDRMFDNNKLERGGVGKGRYYRFSSNLYKTFEKSVNYVRDSDIEKRRQKQMIIEFITDRGSINNNEAQSLLNIARENAYRLFKEMEKEELIKQTGKNRYAKYLLLGEKNSNNN